MNLSVREVVPASIHRTFPTLFLKLLPTTGAALLAFAMSNGSLAETSAQEIADARQETQIWTTYALSPYLRAYDLKVSVQEGEARLSGTVDEIVNKELAKEIAFGVEGIKDVNNQIEVLAGHKPAPLERSYGEIVDDAYVSAAVKSKLLWNKSTEGTEISVKTSKGKVTLTGVIATMQAKEAAGRLAIGTRGVTGVSNNLVVKDTSSTGDKIKPARTSTESAGKMMSDNWAGGLVKSALLYSDNVAGWDIDVITSSGVVPLVGKFHSGEGALAIELAQQNVLGEKAQSQELVNF